MSDHDAQIMMEVDRRVLIGDIDHTKRRIAELDSQIEKLQGQRDRHIEHIGRLHERLEQATKPKP